MIVFPMAGMSRRFRDAGYAQPKYMLSLDGATLFAHAVSGFQAYFDREPFLFIAREEPGIDEFLANELAALGVAKPQIVLLPHPTLGQADTVRLGLRHADVDADEPLTIFNIDTFRPSFHYPAIDWMGRADGYLEVMPGSDPGYSYVLPMPGDEGRVAETAEKQVISNLASTGLYWFRRTGDFLDAMDTDSAAATAMGELYIAPLYNALIARGRDVRFHLVAEKDVIFCGTPQQYHALLAEAA